MSDITKQRIYEKGKVIIMKKNPNWSFTHYYPFFFDGGDIHICRIAPDTDSITFDWISKPNTSYTVYYRKRGIGEYIPIASVIGNSYTITSLTEGCDYEFFVNAGNLKSRVRLARCGKGFDTTVNYLHPEDDAYSFSGHYCGSPSLIRHPKGHLLASMDFFQAEYSQNLTLIFRSDDDGKTWKYVTELFPCFWGKMFIYEKDLYMLSVSTEYGDLLIGKSTDGGNTFTEPTVLLRGGGGKEGPGNAGSHKSPMPVVHFGGRIWNTMEWGSWHVDYRHAAMVMSAPEGCDLLDAANWSFSEPVKYDRTWDGLPHSYSDGTIEGSLVEKNGTLYNIMRYDMLRSEKGYGLALVYEVNTDNPEAPLQFDHAISFPANHSKFEIQYHPTLKKYLTIASRLTCYEERGSRNLLSLMASSDLENWEVITDIVDTRHSAEIAGFQYVDFLIEGNKLLYLCRTATNRPNSYHNSNYITFGTLNLEKYIPELRS